MKNWISRLTAFILMIVAFAAGGLVLPRLQPNLAPAVTPIAQAPTVRPSETFPPTTLLPSITPLPPTNTLRPPPTFEPPTLTPPPTFTLTITPTEGLVQFATIPGLQGLESPTPVTTPAGCTPRADWKLIYEVQPNDALATIAERYGTWANELAQGNCLSDANLIVVGQKLRVPGQAHPAVPQYDCTWTLLAPMNYAYNIDGDGQMTFSWIGPRSPRNLIRVYRSGDTSSVVWEETIDLRQNHTITLPNTITVGGEFMWYVYPLDLNFNQVDCLEGGPWYFHKSAALPTPTQPIIP